MDWFLFFVRAIYRYSYRVPAVCGELFAVVIWEVAVALTNVSFFDATIGFSFFMASG